jgi:uncharacterized membrane protein YfcA
MELLVYALVGLTAGVLGSMLGVGGGILMVPAMVYFCHVPTKSAAAMSLAVMVPMALTSTIRYLNIHEVREHMRFMPIVLMAALAIGGAFLGTEVSKHLSGVTLKRIFAVIMAVVAVYMFFDKKEPTATKEGAGPAAAAGSAEGAKQP